MKVIIRTYLPSMAIVFTIVVLATILFNLAVGPYYTVSSVTLFTDFVIIVAIEAVDYFISMFSFKSKFQYLAVSSLLEYAIVLAACAVFVPGILTPAVLAFTFVVFFGCQVLIHSYFHTVRQYEADEINRILAGLEK